MYPTRHECHLYDHYFTFFNNCTFFHTPFHAYIRKMYTFKTSIHSFIFYFALVFLQYTMRFKKGYVYHFLSYKYKYIQIMKESIINYISRVQRFFGHCDHHHHYFCVCFFITLFVNLCIFLIIVKLQTKVSGECNFQISLA